MSYRIKKISPREFPSQLMEIPQPPEDLWLAGELPSASTTLLAVVGSRKYTTYGKEVCETLIDGLRGLPVAIVSGLALGIDSIAHESALRNQLPTIAVPGSGLDQKVIYPRSHVQLAERIVEQGGCLLSEFPPDMKATTWSFPQRNRIMAGLCTATLVIEAGAKSGTLITSRLATDYNRDVLTVPGSIFSDNSRGPNMLLRLGATPITSIDDLREALGFARSDDDVEEEAKQDTTHLPESEQEILEFLNEPRDKDTIVSLSGRTAREVNVLLMRLEIAGYISDSDGKIRRV